MKRNNPSYLYFFILAALSQPGLAYADTTPPAPSSTKPTTTVAPTTVAPITAAPTTVAPTTPPATTAVAPAPAASASASASTNSAPPAPAAPSTPSTPSTPPAPSTTASAPPATAPSTPPASAPAAPSTPPTSTASAPSAPANYYLPANAAGSNMVSSTLADKDMSAAGLTLSFNGMNVQLNGSIPLACANNLVMDVVRTEPTDAIDDSTDLEASSDLDKVSAKVGVRVTFHGNDKQKTLADCMANENGAGLTDVSTLAKLNKPTLKSENEYARMGLMGDDGKPALGKAAIKSSSYEKMSKVLTYKDCSSCTVSLKNVQAAISELDDQPVSSDNLRGALIDKGLAGVTTEISNANSVSKIKSIRDELVSYTNWIHDMKTDSDDRDSRMSQIQDALTALQSKTGDLAYGDAKNADKYADLISQTGGVIGNMSALDSDFRDQQKAVKAGYAKSGSERLDFISSINPDDNEVRTYLNGAAQQLHSAQLKVNAACKATMSNRNAINSNACQQSIAQMQSIQTEAEGLATKFQAGQEYTGALAPTAQDSFAYNPTLQATNPMKGYFPFGNGSANLTNGQSAQNANFGLPSSLFPNANMYSTGSNSQYQVTAPNYTAGANSQYKISNPTQVNSMVPAVPLSGQLIPTEDSGYSVGPNYQFSMNSI